MDLYNECLVAVLEVFGELSDDPWKLAIKTWDKDGGLQARFPVNLESEPEKENCRCAVEIQEISKNRVEFSLLYVERIEAQDPTIPCSRYYTMGISVIAFQDLFEDYVDILKFLKHHENERNFRSLNKVKKIDC